MTQGLTKGGIALEEAIKAYLLDVTMFINPPLTANGSILQMSAKEARTFFEFGSTLATKSLRPILETISQNAQFSITEALFFPATAGSVSAKWKHKKKGKQNGATKNEKQKESFHCQITFSLPSKTEKKQTKKEKKKDKIDAKRNEKRKKNVFTTKNYFQKL